MGIPSAKIEFPPLLELGLHKLAIADLRALCVDRFPLSTTRGAIMDGLEFVVGKLCECGVVGEIWADGSFLTEKIQANDVDLILRVSGEYYDSEATDEQRATMDWVGNNLRADHLCDSYLHFEYAEGHPRHWLGEYMKAYWMKQWGFGRNGPFKGIAVVELGI